MFFIKLTKLIAWLMVILSGFNLIVGFLAAFGIITSPNEQSMRQLLGAPTIGGAIDRSSYIFAIGLILGLVADIANSLRKLVDNPNGHDIVKVGDLKPKLDVPS